jgi:hypothetical protein
MPLTPITDTADIATAFAALSANWKTGALRASRVVSWRPATQTFDVWYRPQEAAWAVLDLRPQATHHYIFVGLEFRRDPLNVDCQFDPSTSGFTRRHGGVFLRDSDGTVYIGHTGLIGGGVPGVGRHAFVAYAGGTVSITWPDGQVTDGFAISGIYSPNLVDALRAFTELKLQFKDAVTT